LAALLLLLAIIGAVVVGDLAVENTAAGAITVLDHPVTGYSDGLLLAMAAALGFVVGLLVVGSVSLRRTRRARRKQLHTAERELTAQLAELERENTRLREELARRDLPARHLVEVVPAADPGSRAGTARRSPAVSAGHQAEPIYAEARRVARLRSDTDLSLLSTDDQARPSRA
jgi:outer membrane murein-binding lipoprotein Lpp